MQNAYSLAMGSNDHQAPRPYRETRRQRLRELLREAGGPSALMALTGVTDTHLTACEKGRRMIGDDMADSLETGMRKPRGWMDSPPGAEPLDAEALSVARLYGRLLAEDQQRVLAFLQALLLPTLPTNAVSLEAQTQDLAPNPAPAQGNKTGDADARYVRRPRQSTT